MRVYSPEKTLADCIKFRHKIGLDVATERISEDADCQGVRATFQGSLGTVRCPMQIDMGFSDVVTPGPVEIDYPTILDQPAPHLRACNRETVVAEKIEAKECAMRSLLPICLAMTAAALPPPCSLAAEGPFQQWRPAEFTFTAADADAVMPRSVRLTGRFTGPDGKVILVPGFWDGGRTWRLRFTPTLPGAWSFQTEASEEEARAFVQVYTGETMRGGEEARRIDVELGDADQLRLHVDDGGDGTSYDHADWADAELVRPDGTTVYLDTLEPLSVRQGHRELARCTNIPGHPLRIGERTFARGLGTHARSEIVYALDGGFSRFRAWVGVDALVRERGSVRFEVVLARRNTARLGRRDAGLHGQEGRFSALPAAGENPLHRHGGFLRVAADGHSLTYTDGTPFFWLGDTWWFCPSDLVPIDGSSNPDIPSAYRELIGLRRQQGYTVVHMAFLGTIGGISPFEHTAHGPDLSPEYWRTVDRYMEHANAAGIIPVVGMGWAGRPLSPGDWQRLWRHLVARCGAYAVTWLVCGEYNLRGVDDAKLAETLALGGFIKDVDPYRRAMTIHPWAHSVDRRQAWSEPWYDFIMVQGGHGALPPPQFYRDIAARTPAKPFIEAECRYEGIHTFTDQDVREAAYRAIQCGSFGFTYGSQGLWYPTQDAQDTRMDNWGKPLVWWEAARRPGAAQLGHLRRIYETVDWWRLRPSPDAAGPVDPLDDGSLTVVYDCIRHFGAAVATHAHWSRLDGEDPACIALHPRGRERTALAYPPVDLPAVGADERLWLTLAVGINPKANMQDPQNPADGVGFAVAVDGETVWHLHRREQPWFYHAVDLTGCAGRRTTIELLTDAGPEGNMNWDHALFRRPLIVRTARNSVEPGREYYLAPPPRPVFASADGDRTTVLYWPPGAGPGRHELRTAAPGARYAAEWHDPRTGETLAPVSLTAGGNSLTLPAVPDDLDWVLVLRRQ